MNLEARNRQTEASSWNCRLATGTRERKRSRYRTAREKTSGLQRCSSVTSSIQSATIFLMCGFSSGWRRK